MVIYMFDRFFNQDTPFWNEMGNIFDIFILNTLWLICCLPVITIGPSTTAFYYAMIQLARGESGSVSKDFFRSFKQNFKQGISLGIPLLALGLFLIIDIRMCYHAGTGIYSFFMFFFAAIFLFWLFITLYAFPILAKFDKKNREILLWAFVLSIRNLWRTLLMIAVLAFGLWTCHILIGLIFIAPGLIVWCNAHLAVSALKSYLPNPCAEQELKPLNFGEEDIPGQEESTLPQQADEENGHPQI